MSVASTAASESHITVVIKFFFDKFMFFQMSMVSTAKERKKIVMKFFFWCQRCQCQKYRKKIDWHQFFDVNGVNGSIKEPFNDAFEKHWLKNHFLDVSGINSSIRKTYNSTYEVFLWLIHVFTHFNGVNSKGEKKIGKRIFFWCQRCQW